MEFLLINDVTSQKLKNALGDVPVQKPITFTDKDIIQTYSGQPFIISIISRMKYIKIKTSLENGWPFLQSVMKREKWTGMRIRYVKDAISEFYRWESGDLVRIQYALKDDSRWLWYGKGEIQKWENKEYYTNRVIKKRLTNMILNDYMAKCGYDETLT